MSEDSNLTHIPTAHDKMIGDAEAFRRAIGALIVAAPEIAAFRKRMFDEHLKAGFTADQAIILCQKLTF